MRFMGIIKEVVRKRERYGRGTEEGEVRKRYGRGRGYYLFYLLYIYILKGSCLCLEVVGKYRYKTVEYYYY